MAFRMSTTSSLGIVTSQPSNNTFLEDVGGGQQLSDGSSNLALFSFVVNVYVDGFLCLFGFVGNILTIVVLQVDRVRTSNTILLQALAVFDSMFLTYVTLYVVLRSIYPYTGLLKSIHEINAYIVAFVLPFGWTSQTSTIWLVTMVAIDRYIVVSQPLKAVLWCTVKNARRAVVIMAIAAILFNVPRWPRYYFVAFNGEGNSNSTFVSHMSFNTDYWNEELYRQMYHITLTFLLLFIIPLSILIVLNVRLIQAIKTAMKMRQEMTQQSVNQRQEGGSSDKASNTVTLMMVIVISIFIVCELPDFIASVIGAGKFSVNKIVYSYYAGIKEMLLVFNSSINFYIYCFFQKRFRVTLARLFGLAPKPSPAGSRSTITTLSKTNSTKSLDPQDSNNI